VAAAPEHPLRWLSDRARRAPDSAAVLGPSETLTHAQLLDNLGGWSRLMRAAGLDREKPVAVVTRHRSRLARAIWLALHDGVPLLTVDPSQTQAGSLMRQGGVEQAIADADLALPEGIRRLPARPLDRPAGGARNEATPMDVDKPQLLVPTSGTEGTPRAVMLTCRNIASAAFATNRMLDLQHDDRWLCCLPLTHVAGIMILMRCAAAGAAVCLQESFDPRQVADAMIGQSVSHVSLVPAMLHRLIEADVDPSGLKVAIVGGSGISDRLAKDALASRWPVKIAYGLTETCAHVAMGDLLRSDRSLILQPGSHVEIVDSQDPSGGEMGFIQITGPTVMAGYANPELVPGDGLAGPQTFRTQDLGRMDSDGRLRVIGRGDDMLISGGLNIHPAQVEDLMAACPGISEVAVVGIPDPVWGSRLAALYCGDVDEADVSTWAAENIASALRPRDFRRVPSLPRTSLGKIRRGELGRLI
jgi:O-succinylbenzoic acid--CoA ligase